MTTQWSFGLDSARKSSLRRTRKSFTIPGTGRQAFEVDLGFVRNLWQRQRIVGIRFDCTTPGALFKPLPAAQVRGVLVQTASLIEKKSPIREKSYP
ncbi:MAG: hypothetical protein ACC645_04950 [Pirellulales bacterium]